MIHVTIFVVVVVVAVVDAAAAAVVVSTGQYRNNPLRKVGPPWSKGKTLPVGRCTDDGSHKSTT